MNEKDVVNLYQSLARCRDGFMQTRTRRDERQPVQRMSERDRELRNASATADRPHRWGGGGFQDEHEGARHHPPPQIFTHGDFFENKTRWKREIFMARPPKPPAYLDELAAQQWKAKAKQLAERGDLTPADWNNLELFCVNYSMYRKAVEDLASRGFSIVNSQGGESRNPALSAKADAEKIMIKMSSLLGFDPVSRRRNPVETEEEDELDRLE